MRSPRTATSVDSLSGSGMDWSLWWKVPPSSQAIFGAAPFSSVSRSMTVSTAFAPAEGDELAESGSCADFCPLQAVITMAMTITTAGRAPRGVRIILRVWQRFNLIRIVRRCPSAPG